MVKMKSTVALVLAAGQGSRLEAVVPKQYHKLGGKAVLRWSLEILCEHAKIDFVRVVISPKDKALYDDAVSGLKLLSPIFGGETRQKSAKNGIESFCEIQPARILIHDGARPFINKTLIDRLLLQLKDEAAVIPALKLTDTLKKLNGKWVEKTIVSSKIWSAQTPQAFIFGDIHAAHRSTSQVNFTDDSSIAEYAGIKVCVVEGLEQNIKITFRRDMDKALDMISQSAENLKVGTGFDVHSFGDGNHLMLCGVKIPFDRGLVGHSDGDVAIHAIVDALLGGIGYGDIGEHFSSDTEEWKNQTSDHFLSYAIRLLDARSAHISHLDLTLICNKPRISEFRDVMRNRLAKIMGISFKKINIKGTTTDGLGFTGRGEGIAAQATVTLIVDDD
jgi:2-C-methyl-D-erythritol 4-phosphate cytidylyltransferase/2-C-methyl-D-erythritol 2,4-cyclodiphosphate synthase